MSAWLAGVTFWRDSLSRLGFTLYWAAAAGLGGGYVLGPVYALGVGSIFFVALYVMEHLLKRSGFIGGIFDGVYSGFSIAFSFIVTSVVLSLIVYQKLMHPLALAGVSIFIIGVRMLAKRYYRITDKKRKHRMAQTLGYRCAFQVAQSSVFMGLVVLLFLDTTYFVHGVLFSALFYVLEFIPGVREPIEMERPHSDMDIID